MSGADSTLTTAVVVCAYTMRRWDDLCDALRGAAAQEPAPDELWLVVDHAPEVYERARAELTDVHPRLQIVASHRRQGLSGARNTAIEQVGADLVVFLDDDAVPEPGWLAALVAPYADPDVVAVGGVAKPSWPRDGRPATLPTAGAEESWDARGELDWVVGCTYTGQPQTLTEVRNLMGCSMSFRHRTLVLAGGFLEELGRVGTIPLGCEETELCIRVRTALPGAKILLEPRSRIRHRVSPDRTTWSYLLRRCYAEGLSKAAVTGLIGSAGPLETERGYATAILPGALSRQVRASLGSRSRDRRRSLTGAAAIVAGFAATAAGYARGLPKSLTLAPSSPDLQIAGPRPAGLDDRADRALVGADGGAR